MTYRSLLSFAFSATLFSVAGGLCGLTVSGCSSDEDGPTDLCGKLASAENCTASTTQICNDQIAAEKSAVPSCHTELDALTNCIAGLTLSCTGSSSIAANGDGKFSGNNFISIGSADVVINDSHCDELKQSYSSCRTDHENLSAARTSYPHGPRQITAHDNPKRSVERSCLGGVSGLEGDAGVIGVIGFVVVIGGLCEHGGIGQRQE